VKYTKKNQGIKTFYPHQKMHVHHVVVLVVVEVEFQVQELVVGVVEHVHQKRQHQQRMKILGKLRAQIHAKVVKLKHKIHGQHVVINLHLLNNLVVVKVVVMSLQGHHHHHQYQIKMIKIKMIKIKIKAEEV